MANPRVCCGCEGQRQSESAQIALEEARITTTQRQADM